MGRESGRWERQVPHRMVSAIERGVQEQGLVLCSVGAFADVGKWEFWEHWVKGVSCQPVTSSWDRFGWSTFVDGLPVGEFSAANRFVLEPVDDQPQLQYYD